MYIEWIRYLVREKKNMSSRNKLIVQNPKNKIKMSLICMFCQHIICYLDHHHNGSTSTSALSSTHLWSHVSRFRVSKQCHYSNEHDNCRENTQIPKIRTNQDPLNSSRFCGFEHCLNFWVPATCKWVWPNAPITIKPYLNDQDEGMSY